MEKFKQLSLKRKKRMGAVILAVVMICTMLQGTVFATETNGITECHPAHDQDCGYIAAVEGTSCSRKCDICQPKDSTELKCNCDVKCTQADEENSIEVSINGECPVCGAEDEDLALCKGTAAVPFTVERVVAKRTACLDLRSTILDKDGSSLIPTDGVYDMLTEEGWKWDENTSVLTLNGVNLDVSGNCGILLDKDATIELMGNNSVVTDDSIAIQNFGNITIDGTGSIEVRGMLAGINVDDQLPNTGYNINITGGEVNVISKNDTAALADGAIFVNGLANVEASGYYCGLQANGSGITISGATVTAKSSDDSAIFTKGVLSITDSADINATDSLYSGVNAKGGITITDSTVNAGGGTNSDTGNSYTAIYTPQTLTIDGTSEVTADGDWHGMDAGTALSIGGNAKVTATGSNSGLQSKAVNISGNAVAEATSIVASAIAGSDSISITDNANVTATGAMNGIQAAGNINFTGSKVEAIGNGGCGISSKGKITIDSGAVHAKGASTYAAIRTENVQTGGDAAKSKISLTNLIEKNGGKVAFCDWVSNGGDMTSWTTFIAKDDNGLTTTSEGGFTNGLLEVWLAAPHTVTFDVNVGSGSNSTVKVYPGNNVTAPAIDPAKDGFHFSGWYFDDIKFDFANTSITGDITLKAKLDVHMPGADDGDCTTAIKCSVCNEITAAGKAHDFTGAWETDGSNHWHTCNNTGCTQVGYTVAHTFGKWIIDNEATETVAGSKHRDCDICKYKETVTIPVAPHTHTPSSEWSKDATTHWHNCTANDGVRMNTAAHTPGEGATAQHSQVCTVCGYEIAPKLPLKNVIVDKNTGTKAEYEDGSVFDDDIMLSVTSKSQEEMDKLKNSVDKAAPGLTLGGLYDVKLLKDGVDIKPNGKIKISIPLTNAMKSMTNLQIVYIDANGNVTIIPSEVKDRMITFITDHFSDYGVIGKVKATESSTNTSKGDESSPPQTGDNSSILWLVLMLGASGMTLIVLGKKKKAFRYLKRIL